MNIKRLILGFGLVSLLMVVTPKHAAAVDTDDSCNIDDSECQVPEPTSLALLGAGLAGLAGFAIYRKRR